MPPIDPKTLLFSLLAINAFMAASLLIAARGRATGRRQEGLSKWAAAVLVETAVWVLIGARGAIPDLASIVLANGLKAAVHALALAAIYDFQLRRWPRWQCLLPIALAVLMSAILIDDLRARFVWGGLVYGLQMVLIARALRAHPDSRDSRAGKLLFAGACMILALLGARALVAASGAGQLAEPFTSGTPHPVQMFAYFAILATAVMGSMSFVLMVKEREIMHLATIDSLTQVFSRHALMTRAEAELARRSSQPVAVLMIDVDHFKRINDTLGHPVGDEVLREVAQLLESRLRRYDVLGRYGGEEFCVIAPETDVTGAHALAEDLRGILAATPLHAGDSELAMTISIGVCVGRGGEHGTTLTELLAHADAALYVAKESGRNRVSVCPYCVDAGCTAPHPARAAG